MNDNGGTGGVHVFNAGTGGVYSGTRGEGFRRLPTGVRSSIFGLNYVPFVSVPLYEQSYLDLWKKLPADPTDSEVPRNIGITQPVLWGR